MSDWRLRNQEKYLSGVTLYKVSFPDFWKVAYRDKNAFYQNLLHYAERFVAENDRGAEYLDGEKIQHFWHEHCDFCWEKALTDEDCTFYCTEDMKCWVCAECFLDFREKFDWKERSAEELIDIINTGKI